MNGEVRSGEPEMHIEPLPDERNRVPQANHLGLRAASFEDPVLTLAAIALTLFLVWMGAGQCCLVASGRKRARDAAADDPMATLRA